jgi:hypothetical protein
MTRIPVLLLAAAALLGAGCGSGDKTSDSEIGAAERGQILISANLKVADTHPEDGQLVPSSVKLRRAEDALIHLEAVAEKTAAKWSMVLSQKGKEPFNVDVYVREEPE